MVGQILSLRSLNAFFVVLGAAMFLVACDGENAPALLSAAKGYLAKGDNKAAVIQLKNALQKSPNLAEARFLLGATMLESGNAAGAVAELQRALDLGYPPGQAVPLMAKALIADHQQKQLIEQFGKTDLQEPLTDADLKTSLAAAYLEQGRRDKAHDTLALALQKAPDFPAALRLQAALTGEEGHIDTALALLDKVIASNPRDAAAWHSKGNFLIRGKNDAVGALAAYRQALGVSPAFTPARESLVMLLLDSGDLGAAATEIEPLRKAMPGDPHTLYLDAELAYLKKDYKRAREITQQLAKTAPGSVWLLQLEGVVAFRLGLLAEAQRFFTQVLELSPNFSVARRLLAQTYMRQGQPARALGALQPLLDHAPGDAQAEEIAAEANMQVGDLSEARKDFAKAAKSNPHDVKSHVAAAMERFARGDHAGAIAELQSIATSDKGIYADVALVSAYVRDKNYSLALKSVDAIEAKLPDRPGTADLRGKVLLSQNSVAEARRSFERALTIDPAFVSAAINLAKLDLADKNPAMAMKRFESVVAADPKNLEALLAIAVLREKAGAPSEEIASRLTHAADLNPMDEQVRVILVNHFLEHKDAKAALAAAQKAVADFPDSSQALDTLGRAQMANGDTNQAIASFGKLASLDSGSPTAQMHLAAVYLSTKNDASAIESLERALKITPNLLSAQRLLIDLEIKSNRAAEALLVARTIEKQRPLEQTGYMLEGVVEATRHNWPAAAEIFRTTLKKFPTTAPAIGLHSVLVASGQQREADKFSSSWMSGHPQDAGFLVQLGSASLAKHDYAAAEELFQRVLRITPDNVIALNNVAWTMTKLNEPGAVAYAQKAVGLAPEAPALLDTLATVYAAENKLDNAIDAQKKALALAPTNSGFRLNLAKIYIQAGDKASARIELQALSRENGSDNVKAEIDQLLKQL